MAKKDALQHRSMVAGIWALIQNSSKVVILFIVFLILARFFLNDQEFGIAALANSIIVFSQIMGQSSLSMTLIQKKDLTDRHKTAVFWLQVIFSVVLGTLVFLGAPSFARWADEPLLSPVVQVLSLSIPIVFLGMTHEALLRRDLKFRPLAARTFVASIIGSIAALVVAQWGGGVWALVALNMVTAAVSTVLLWRASPWRPTFILPLAEIKEMAPTGGNLAALGMVRYVDRNIGRLIIGFFIGISELGLFYIAQRVITAFSSLLNQSINSVALPVFSEIQHDMVRVRSVFIKSMQVCLVICLPAFLGVSAIAGHFIPLVMGEKWQSAAILLTILGWSATLRAVLFFSPPVLIAVSQSAVVLRNTTLNVIVQVICLGIGAYWGLIGICYALVLRQIIMNGVWFHTLANRLGLDLRVYFRQTYGIVLAAGTMVGVVLALKWTLLSAVTWPNMIGLMLAGGLIYGLALFVFQRPVFMFLFQMVRKKLPS